MGTRHWLLLSVLTVVGLGCGGRSAGSTNDVRPIGGALSARITQPNGNVTVLAGRSVELRARFFVAASEVTPESVTWSSSVKGSLGEANPLEQVVLTEGEHVVSVAGDYGGNAGADEITVTVGNLAVGITRPGNEQHHSVGELVVFSGEAFVREGLDIVRLSTDPLPDEREATFAWSSSLDGSFGPGLEMFTYNTLSAGKHVLTLTVTDTTTGAQASASIELVINSEPEVSITAPGCPFQIAAASPQTFAGLAIDAEEGNLVGSWRDTLTGASRSGNTFDFSSTIVGKHQVVFAATDTLGDTGYSTCSVLVFPAGGSRTDVYPNTSAVNDALPEGQDDVRYVDADGAGNLWVGNVDGLAIFDSSLTQVGSAYDGAALGVGSSLPTVRDAAVAGGSALVATSEGLALCTYATAQLGPCRELEDGDFRAVATTDDPAGTALVAAATADDLYLASFTAGAETERVYGEGANALPDGGARSVLFVETALYVGTDGGLCVIEDPIAAAAGTVTPLCSKILSEENSILPSDSIRALARSGETLWIGTSAGLVRYELETGGMIVYRSHDGLAHDEVNDIAVDSAGIVWVATDNGVSRFDPAAGSFTNQRHSDWATGSSSVHHIYLAPDGTKWFGTEQGLVRYVGA